MDASYEPWESQSLVTRLQQDRAACHAVCTAPFATSCHAYQVFLQYACMQNAAVGQSAPCRSACAHVQHTTSLVEHACCGSYKKPHTCTKHPERHPVNGPLMQHPAEWMASCLESSLGWDRYQGGRCQHSEPTTLLNAAKSPTDTACNVSHMPQHAMLHLQKGTVQQLRRVATQDTSAAAELGHMKTHKLRHSTLSGTQRCRTAWLFVAVLAILASCFWSAGARTGALTTTRVPPGCCALLAVLDSLLALIILVRSCTPYGWPVVVYVTP